jgi:hypothetical protein
MIEPGRGDVAPGLAKYLLGLDSAPPNRRRYHALAGKARDGSLSYVEPMEHQNCLGVIAFLS